MKVKFTTNIDSELLKMFKIKAIEEGVNINSLLEKIMIEKMLKEYERVSRKVYLRDYKEILEGLREKAENNELTLKEKLQVLDFGLDVDENQIFYDKKAENIYIYDLVNKKIITDINATIEGIYIHLDFEE